MEIRWIWTVEDLRFELVWNGPSRLMVGGRLCSIVLSCNHSQAFPTIGPYRATC